MRRAGQDPGDVEEGRIYAERILKVLGNRPNRNTDDSLSRRLHDLPRRDQQNPMGIPTAQTGRRSRLPGRAVEACSTIETGQNRDRTTPRKETSPIVLDRGR